MGKWTEVARGLKRREPEPGKFRDAVHAIKDETRAYKLEELAAKYRALRKALDVLEDQVTAANARKLALEELIAEQFRLTERDKPFYFEDGKRVEVSDQISVRCSDRDANVAWLKAHAYERLLTVNPKTLEGLVKSALEANLEVPAGVEVTAYSQVKLA